MTRIEAIEILKDVIAYESDFAEAKQMAIEALEQIPRRAEGAWITACNSYEIICSNCESEAFSEDGEYIRTNFCPDCGARMRG